MKRMMALLLTLALLLALFAGCQKKDAGTDTKTADASALTAEEAEALYAPLIEKYREAFSDFNLEHYDLEINYLLVDYYCNDAGGSTVGYAIFDVNRDGTPELLIGEKDAQNPEQMSPEGLAGIYTLKDGAPNWLIGSDYEDAGVSVLNNGTILEKSVYWGHRIEWGVTDAVYTLKDGTLSIEKTYFGVPEYDDAGNIKKITHACFVDGELPIDSNQDVLLDQMQPMEEGAYKAVLADLEAGTATLPITLFAS